MIAAQEMKTPEAGYVEDQEGKHMALGMKAYARELYDVAEAFVVLGEDQRDDEGVSLKDKLCEHFSNLQSAIGKYDPAKGKMYPGSSLRIHHYGEDLHWDVAIDIYDDSGHEDRYECGKVS